MKRDIRYEFEVDGRKLAFGRVRGALLEFFNDNPEATPGEAVAAVEAACGPIEHPRNPAMTAESIARTVRGLYTKIAAAGLREYIQTFDPAALAAPADEAPAPKPRKTRKDKGTKVDQGPGDDEPTEAAATETTDTPPAAPTHIPARIERKKKSKPKKAKDEIVLDGDEVAITELQRISEPKLREVWTARAAQKQVLSNVLHGRGVTATQIKAIKDAMDGRPLWHMAGVVAEVLGAAAPAEPEAAAKPKKDKPAKPAKDDAPPAKPAKAPKKTKPEPAPEPAPTDDDPDTDLEVDGAAEGNVADLDRERERRLRKRHSGTRKSGT